MIDKIKAIIGTGTLIYILYLEYRLRSLSSQIKEAKIEAFKAQAINRIKSMSDDELRSSLDKRLRDS